MHEIAVMGSEYFTLGFQSAGVRNVFVVDKQNINRSFEEVMGRKDIGILIMNNDDFLNLNERLREKALVQVQPTVVILSHDVSAEENLRIMIKRSLGVDLWEKKG
jgi:V/A-type H+-transporting ATPase subunit F